MNRLGCNQFAHKCNGFRDQGGRSTASTLVAERRVHPDAVAAAIESARLGRDDLTFATHLQRVCPIAAQIAACGGLDGFDEAFGEMGSQVLPHVFGLDDLDQVAAALAQIIDPVRRPEADTGALFGIRLIAVQAGEVWDAARHLVLDWVPGAVSETMHVARERFKEALAGWFSGLFAYLRAERAAFLRA